MSSCYASVGPRLVESSPFESIGELVGEESDEGKSETLSDGNAELIRASLTPEACARMKGQRGALGGKEVLR